METRYEKLKNGNDNLLRRAKHSILKAKIFSK